MKRKKSLSARVRSWLVPLFVLVALAMTGFAHSAMPQAGPVPAELAAYALPDGTLPDLCLPGEEDGSADTNHPLTGGMCDFCQIAGAIAIPVPPVVGGEPLVRDGPRRPVARIAVVRVQPAFPPAAPPQGPPFLLS